MRTPDFNIIAVRVLKDHSTGQKILEANKMYYLLKGYEIKGNEIMYLANDAIMPSLYTDFVNRYRNSPLHINISAIVGSNGSGKSTIVELIIRLLNNFAASLYGETQLYPAAERLHYVDGVYGELFFTIGGEPHLLRVEGDKVELFIYTRHHVREDDEKRHVVRFGQKEQIYKRDCRRKWSIGGNAYYSKWRKKRKVFQRIADHIFYSFVSNYSLYAYNPNDFRDEWNKGTNSCWLNGLFHKNDGYQTPIVLTPYRTDGNINVNKEAKLSNERLISLLLTDIGYSELNGHLEVVEFRFEKSGKNYEGKDSFNNLCEMHVRQRGFCKLRNAIKNCWQREYGCNFKKSENLPLYETALNYLTIKTIKTAKTYGPYNAYYKKICHVERWIKEKHKNAIEGLVNALSIDHSHITRKIRRTLCFLVRGSFGGESMMLQDAINECKYALRSMREDYRMGMPTAFNSIEDVLPAPFIEVSIIMKEKNGEIVSFDKLSSGERQQIYSISSILYHVSNIDSVHDDMNHKRVAYKRIAIVLEEIELYYHPQLQREFVMYLLKGLRQMRFSKVCAMSILIVTHSPFVLSDIPASNILVLNDGRVNENTLQSFGANIHDMLNTNFFMTKGCRGLFAELVILEVIKMLESENERLHRTIHDRNAREYIFRLIQTIDEPIIQRILLNKFYSKFHNKTIDEEIYELETRLKVLKQKQ